MPITLRLGEIDGKCATPTVSGRSEFARTTITKTQAGVIKRTILENVERSGTGPEYPLQG